MIGGGYTVTDEEANILEKKEIKKKNFTNNEAELRGIYAAIELADHYSTISSDSKVCINWVRKGAAGSRIDLNFLAKRAQQELKTKNVLLIWEPREMNLAGKYNEKFEGWMNKYK